VRITIDIDTSQITADDRRVLMALAGHDAGELRVTRLDEPATPPTPAPPLPVPVPAAFASKLGEAVAQFSPRGSGSEARLPFAQQAGVRTSSTMPDDDEAPPPGPRVDYVPGPQMRELMEEQRVFGVDALDETTTVVAGAVRDGVVHITDHVRVPRELVEGDAATAGDFESAVMHAIETQPALPDDADTHAHAEVPRPKSPVIENPPVRHTSP
jgi:hypothetical protein